MCDKVIIPFYENEGDTYPGNIKPGEYNVAELLRAHKSNPEAIQFIADMVEE